MGSWNRTSPGEAIAADLPRLNASKALAARVEAPLVEGLGFGETTRKDRGTLGSE